MFDWEHLDGLSTPLKSKNLQYTDIFLYTIEEVRVFGSYNHRLSTMVAERNSAQITSISMCIADFLNFITTRQEICIFNWTIISQGAGFFLSSLFLYCAKMKFSIKDFFSFLRIWSHLLKKSLMKNLIFCALLLPLFWWPTNHGILVRLYEKTSIFHVHFLVPSQNWVSSTILKSTFQIPRMLPKNSAVLIEKGWLKSWCRILANCKLNAWKGLPEECKSKQARRNQGAGSAAAPPRFLLNLTIYQMTMIVKRKK